MGMLGVSEMATKRVVRIMLPDGSVFDRSTTRVSAELRSFSQIVELHELQADMTGPEGKAN